MHHFRSTRTRYNKHNQSDKTQHGCSLCRASQTEQSVDATSTCVVVRNRVAYDVFEGLRTTGEHYLVIPKQHRESIDDFTSDEKLEMMDLIGKYEAQGFSVYARGVGNVNRSQPHQHTHLIKLTDQKARLMIYLSKPYILASFGR